LKNTENSKVQKNAFVILYLFRFIDLEISLTISILKNHRSRFLRKSIKMDSTVIGIIALLAVVVVIGKYKLI